MSSKPGLYLFIASVLLCIAMSGCMPSSQSPLDEQKEPHFLTGKARENALDYTGAIEAFEKALEANPKNGSAHFELGLLYEKESDYSAAIYHFERYLKLRPNTDYSQIVKERINADKMELSKTAAFAPVTQNLQREFEKEIAKLNGEIARLNEENRQLRTEVERWRTFYASRTAPGPSIPPAGPAGSVPTPNFSSTSPAPLSSGGSSSVRPVDPAPASPTRTHVVQAGETPYSIARKFGVKLDALMNANRGLDPRKLKVGQTINVPAP